MTMVINGSGSITGLSAGGLPDGTIQQADLATGVAGTGPAFSAYLPSSQTVSANTFTKVAFSSENFDTNNNFDSTTNYRFTPTVAGYYQFSMNLYVNSGTRVIVTLYKNGALVSYGSDITGSNIRAIAGSVLVYANGSTDYFEMYGFADVTAFVGSAGGTQTYFTGSLARAA